MERIIDWALVAKVGGGGFAITFLVLTILALVIWLAGWLIRKTEPREQPKSKTGDEETS